jgi:hypothetical protein
MLRITPEDLVEPLKACMHPMIDLFFTSTS